MAKAVSIVLSEPERQALLSWTRSGSTEHRMVERARIILLAAENRTTQEIAKQLKTRPARVSKWRGRFARKRIGGLQDTPRQGPPERYDANTESRILGVLDDPPPSGFATWTGSLVAKRLGDVSKHQVWRVLRKHEIHLQRRRS